MEALRKDKIKQSDSGPDKYLGWELFLGMENHVENYKNVWRLASVRIFIRKHEYTNEKIGNELSDVGMQRESITNVDRLNEYLKYFLTRHILMDDDQIQYCT